MDCQGFFKKMCITASSFTDLYYILRKHLEDKKNKQSKLFLFIFFTISKFKIYNELFRSEVDQNVHAPQVCELAFNVLILA
jgi:hypothetical protein